MCRAVWVVIVGASDAACKRLRRAAGVDVHVVGMTTTVEEAASLASSTRADAFVVDAALSGAAGLVAAIRGRARDAAVVWLGEDAPEGAHHAVPDGEDVADRLPAAITKALLARRV